MRNLLKSFFTIIALVGALAFALGPVVILAADPTPSAATGPVLAPATPAQTAGIVQVLIPIIVPIGIMAIKWSFPKIPKPVLPILCPILGALIDVIGHFAGASSGGPLVGAILGASGVFVREAWDQAKKGLAGETYA